MSLQGVRFKRVIMDDSATDRSPYPPEDLSFRRVVLCSGKVRPRWALWGLRSESGGSDVAISMASH